MASEQKIQQITEILGLSEEQAVILLKVGLSLQRSGCL